MIKRVCQFCGKEYETFKSVKPQYCSIECAGSAKKKGSFEKCSQCGKEFWKYPSTNKRYCSKSCAATARNLTENNPAYHRNVSGENNPMYGKPGLSGEKNPMFGKRGELCINWKGGRKIRKDGYIIIPAPSGHPYAHDKKILEHRLVMETSIGRYLDPSEVVHHINGNPSDNRIENLRLFKNQAEHIREGHTTH